MPQAKKEIIKRLGKPSACCGRRWKKNIYPVNFAKQNFYGAGNAQNAIGENK